MNEYDRRVGDKDAKEGGDASRISMVKREKDLWNNMGVAARLFLMLNRKEATSLGVPALHSRIPRGICKGKSVAGLRRPQ